MRDGEREGTRKQKMPSSQGTDRRVLPHHLAATAAARSTPSTAVLRIPAPFVAARRRCCLQAGVFAEHLTRYSVVEGRQI